MKKHLLIICICIVLLFIPVSSAVDVNTNVDSEPIENPEIEPLDNKGYDYDYILIEGTYDYLEKKGIFLCWDVHFGAGSFDTHLSIEGFKFPFKHIFTESYVYNLDAERFIGVCIPMCPIWGSVYGIAWGDIKWS